MPQNTSLPITKEQVFSRVPKSSATVYSTFDRGNRHLTAFDASYLIPLFVDEVYPGDIYDLTGHHLNRLLDIVHPFMDNLVASFYYFYCPTRLIWNNFKSFMGERRRPDESISDSYQVPMLNSGEKGVEVNSIFDYAGIPVNVPNLEFSSLPFRAMNLTYNEWFRDENLCSWLQVGGVGSSETELKANEFGDSDQLSNYKLFKRAKAHDYFTSTLPFQQKGEAMSISIGKSAPVIGNGLSMGLTDGSLNLGLGFQQYMAGSYGIYGFSGAQNLYGQDVGGKSGTGFGSTPGAGIGLTPEAANSGVIADLTNVTGFTISDLRTAIQLQALKELNARTGTRYKEIINGEWNVQISDATLDRPEFLGSYKIPFNIVTVASTAETETNPQGNLSAYGFTDNSGRRGFSKGFEEHGYVIGFCCVTTDQTYQYGLERFWSRKNRYDFYTPLLANISEQAVKNKELFAQGSSVIDEDSNEPVDEKTFGYQEAWAELRYKPNRVSGQMRSGLSEGKSLDIWHLAAQSEATVLGGKNLAVPLNSDFIEDNTNITLKRVLAVEDEPQILSDNYFELKCTRELPIYSVPSYLLGGRL